MEQKLVVCVLFFLMTQYVLHIDTSRSVTRSKKLISYSLPQNRPLKKALGFNEDIYLNFTELTTKYEYPTEVHTVTTEDGYVLTVFRILSKCSETIQPYPVILMHGFLDTADTWILSGTEIGLGYVLANNCYDVWLPNGRGNHYSRRHLKLDPNKDPEYWNYTFDEHGNFDVPAAIDYVLQVTGRSKLFYIGHSEGTANFLVMCCMRPEYNDKIGIAILLGPVAWMKNFRHPVFLKSAQNYMAIKSFFVDAGILEIFARDHIIHVILELICEMLPYICDLGITLTIGQKPGTIPLQNISIGIGHVFSGSSIKALAHFAQLIVSENFQRYDEGTKGNLKRYGILKPPQYNISQISSPIVLISAESDEFSRLKDVEILSSKLPNLLESYVVPKAYWSHYNHIWDPDAVELVYPKILDYFKKYKN